MSFKQPESPNFMPAFDPKNPPGNAPQIPGNPRPGTLPTTPTPFVPVRGPRKS